MLQEIHHIGMGTDVHRKHYRYVWILCLFFPDDSGNIRFDMISRVEKIGQESDVRGTVLNGRVDHFRNVGVGDWIEEGVKNRPIIPLRREFLRQADDLLIRRMSAATMSDENERFSTHGRDPSRIQRRIQV